MNSTPSLELFADLTPPQAGQRGSLSEATGSSQSPTFDELTELHKRINDANNSGVAGGDSAARRAAFRADFAAVVTDLGKRQVVAPSLPNVIISEPPQSTTNSNA